MSTGTITDRYDLDSPVPDGVGGTVAGRHRELGRDVVITIVSAAMRRDALALRTAKHRHVVPIVDVVDLDAGRIALVRPVVRGVPLAATLSGSPEQRSPRWKREIHAAACWARDRGIAHRVLGVGDVIVQQGSNRALLMLPTSARVANVDDVGSAAVESMLDGAIASRPAPTVAPPVSTPVSTPVSAPIRTAPQPERAGVRARAAALISAAIIVLGGAGLWARLDDGSGERTRARYIDSAAGTIDPRGTASKPATKAATKRATPTRSTPARSPAPRTTAAPKPAAPVADCDNAAASAQRRCLSSLIRRNDGELNRTYQSVIASLRARADSTGDDDAVDELRSEQRDWLASREAECSAKRTSGALWARAHAACLAEISAARVRELEAMRPPR
jgi:uncharacterized protein YecT (DUF1311 family)